MVNGNYVLYGDRSCSESEIVDDHVQTRTTERKVKRKANRTANELQHSLNLAKLENDTDSVKYEKKIKEPRLLRYVPTTDVEEHYVTEKFETYDLRPSEELPRKHNYTKKPKNPADGSFHYCNSRSSSSCSSPNGNLPTISEQCEQYGTYRIRAVQAPPLGHIGFDNKLDKYFAKPKEVKSFTAKVGYTGSHPDNLYRVATDSTLSGSKAARVARVMRWPLALLVICVALGGFVYFLMPVNLNMDIETANTTNWEERINAAQSHSILNKIGIKTTETKDKEMTRQNSGSKTPEIDFYEADTDKDYEITISDTNTGINLQNKLPTPPTPVFPTHISPEVQYGNEKTRIPKLFNEIQNTLPEDSTSKPHITQKPEKPLAIYFRDGGAITASSNEAIAVTENFANAETSNGLSGFVERVNEGENAEHQDMDNAKQETLNEEKSTKERQIQPEILNYYGQAVAVNHQGQFTSGHSKIFGVSIEHAANMKSTTQHSLYNTKVSPTLPTWRDKDDTTTKKYPVNNNPDVPQCRSTRLVLCRGILPYDLAGSSAVVGNTDVATLLPQIEYLVNSNCSERVKHFACALLEPECSPPPFPPKLPCYNFCKAIVDSCDGSIPAELSRIFYCNQYSSNDCVTARTPCLPREFQCGDGTCVPRDWVCDSAKDCTEGEDESQCSICSRNEYRCSTGMCISKNWLCDGYADCSGGEDEADTLCGDRNRRRDHTAVEIGEEIAGSAPEPSVRRPNRLHHSNYDRNDGLHPNSDTDSSKELLMTSDTNNGYRRNYTRRPSPARLTPYKRQRLYTESEPRSTTPETPVTDPTKITKKPNKLRPGTEPLKAERDQESVEDLGDFKFYSEDDKVVKPVSQYTLQNPTTVGQTLDRAPSPAPAATTIDKMTSKLQRYIDGAAMLKKAEQELETTDAPDSLESNSTFAVTEKEEWGGAWASAYASTCPSGELRCVDGRCITLAQLCDGTIDCSDHADEDNCFT